MTLEADIENIVIEHFGRKGQKWGVRRSDKELASDPVGRDSDNVRRSRGEKKDYKKTNQYSNQELQAAITRMNLEMQYKRLTEKPTLTSKGTKIAGGILLAVGTAAAKEVIGNKVNVKLTDRGLLPSKGGKPVVPNPTKGFITPLPRSFPPPLNSTRYG